MMIFGLLIEFLVRICSEGGQLFDNRSAAES